MNTSCVAMLGAATAAPSQMRQGYYSVLIEHVKDTIRKVLQQHGEMYELEFGLAVIDRKSTRLNSSH